MKNKRRNHSAQFKVNVALHVIEHDIVLTQDIIFGYKTIGKASPVIKV